MAASLVFFEEHTAHNLRKERIFRDRTSQLDSLSDDELLRRYRMPRYALLEILERVRPVVEHQTRRSKALSPETQLMVSLRYLCKSGFLLELGDLHAVSEASVCRAFHRTIAALCVTLPPIAFPGADAQHRLQREFYQIAHFPWVIGAIDGTIIPIKRPNEEEAAFICRKGFHALNVQAVCDANLRFTNSVVKWPGSCHDAYILSNSQLGQAMEVNNNGGWLLGDSGYQCRPWLLTPVHEPANRGEERYNSAHIRTRNTIERAFGVLKSRFRCLHKSTGCLQFNPVKSAKITMAAFLLHNFCMDLKVPFPEPIDLEDEHVFEVERAVHPGGNQVRQNLIQNVFS